MALSFAFDPSKGETPESVAKQREIAALLASRIFGRAPRNVGEGLSSIGQALIARKMMGDANAAQAAGQNSANSAFSQIVSALSGGTPATAATAPATPSIPSTPSVPPEAFSGTSMSETAAPLSGGTLAAPTAAKPDAPSTSPYANAISSLESRGSGGYSALGPVVKSGDRAYGKYQVMGQNIPEWTKQVLGVSMTPDQFLSDPKAQDAVFNAKFGEYVKKYGPEGAARAWFAGEGGMNNLGARDVTGTSVAQYSKGFTNALGQQPVQVASNDPTFAPSALAFNGQPQNANPLSDASAFAPQPNPGFAPAAGPQPNITTIPVRPAQLPIAPQTAQAAPQAAPAAPTIPGPSMDMLMQAASNPFLSAGQRAVVNSMIKQRLELQQQANDPLRQLQIEKARRDLQAPQGPATVQEYEFAKSHGFNGTFQDWIATKRAGAGEFGLQPIYGRDKNGNLVIMQLGKGGTAVQSKLPEGVKVTPGVTKIDLGTSWGIMDNKSGTMVGVVPKDLAGAEAEKAKGKIEGETRGSLPTSLLTANQTVTQIDQLLKNPGLDSIVGPLDQFRPSYTLGDDGRDALARYNQLKGKAFLSAYATLKGGGQITEVEGKKAEDAMARMDRSQDEATFRQALTDFRDAVKQGVEKLREKAGLPPAPMQAPAAPAGNTTNTGVQWSVE